MTSKDGAQPVAWHAAGRGLAATPEFAAAARSVLRLLRDQLGHDLWMVTRVDGDDLLVVECLDFAYGLRPGVVLPWTATLDWQLVHGHGPPVAPSVADVPAYADAALTRHLRIGSYAGVPLVHGGVVVGTLTGLHPEALPASVAGLLPTVETLAGLLAALLAAEVRAYDATRRAARAEAEATVDTLTQLGNRLAWTKALSEEDTRCRRYGHSAVVVSVDLDGLKWTNDRFGHDAGDRLLRDAALVLRRVSRMCDQVARVGGDEFAVLAVEAGEEQGGALLERLREALRGAGVEASLGIAVSDPASTLQETWQDADAAMYRDKRRRMVARAAEVRETGGPRQLSDVPSQASPGGT
ncbi:MAG TPA: sensor domain-containing diguanylate cyclase [Mycobacteriales bacterium]|nr:sensor domain-containing diguanylate cyclase [Mycobacteriales bacterium]